MKSLVCTLITRIVLRMPRSPPLSESPRRLPGAPSCRRAFSFA